MVKSNYTACATRPEEVVVCSALNAGNYPAEYAEKVKSIFGTIQDDGLRKRVESTLGKFESGTDDKLAQSSPYRLVLLQEIIPKERVLVARPRLEVAKQNNPDFMSGFYVDCGLNLVSGEEGYQVNSIPTKALAKDLTSIGFNLTNPKLISINALTYEVNEKSPSGLVFRLSEQGKDNARALILNTLDFKWDYLPSRTGLFGAYLYRNGHWRALDEDLAYSYDGGRVVVETTGEASALEFDVLKRQSEELFDRQRRERETLANKLLA